MGCCSSKKEDKSVEVAVVVKPKQQAAAPAAKTKTKTNGGGGGDGNHHVVSERGEDNKGFAHVESPTITITTADEVNAQFEAARIKEEEEREARRKMEEEEEEEAKRKLEEEAKRRQQEQVHIQQREEDLKEEVKTEVVAAAAAEKKKPMVGGGHANKDEMDGIPSEVAVEGMAKSGRVIGEMETIGEEEEEEEEEETEADLSTNTTEEQQQQQQQQQQQDDRQRPQQPQHATLAPTKSNPTSRKFSQIAPGSVDSPDAVKLNSKFTMIPTGGETIVEEWIDFVIVLLVIV